MSERTVKTQAELDQALADRVEWIDIRSEPGVWLEISSTGSAQVRAYGSAQVTAYGSAQVTATGSAQVTAYGSAQVTAYGSAQVTAYGSAQVRAYGSAQVTATKYVAVHLHSKHVHVEGGVVIDVTDVDLTDTATWLGWHGIEPTDGKVVLFKAVDAEFYAGHSYTKTRYAVGDEPVAKDWKPGNFCGGGLHLGPTPVHALAYRENAAHFVACEVAVEDISPIHEAFGSTAKCKVRACRVLHEVDINGAVIHRKEDK